MHIEHAVNIKLLNFINLPHGSYRLKIKASFPVSLPAAGNRICIHDNSTLVEYMVGEIAIRGNYNWNNRPVDSLILSTQIAKQNPF
jgi:hypothetical protein